MSRETESGAGGRAFPETRWTLILDARRDPESRRAALEELFAVYWRPLYFFARRKGLDVEAAKDAVQDLAAQLVEREALDRLDPSRGRFRSYLRTSLANHLANLHERRTAQKRGGGWVATVDLEAAEAALDEAAADPGQAFDREWALSIAERALGLLRVEFESGLRGGPFELVERFFKPGAEAPSHADAAREAHMTPVQFKAFLHRARTRYRELVRSEVAQTVRGSGGDGDDADIDLEMAELMRSLGG